MMYVGAKCAFTSGDIRKIMDELALARPTVFGAVPRTLNKLYEKVNQTLEQPGWMNWIKSSLVSKAMKSKRAYLDKGVVTKVNLLYKNLSIDSVASDDNRLITDEILGYIVGQFGSISNSKTTRCSNSHDSSWSSTNRTKSEGFYPGDTFYLRCRGKV